ncbi:hypothetical protein ILUMI_04194 [Ignelater luminosus]|uniref:Uncharacterized protein n=1 Tax=Ignelater luminosus TaxID=2038154 RepID=A0A8K0GJ90_IGNLU|nr:hypothetical protein ILUMI_04194 [Ignelater luminosus]
MLKPLLDKLHAMRVVLASSSTQRHLLLESTTLKFEICASDFEENLNPEDYTFSEFVQETALGKVEDVYEKLKNDKVKPDIIIGVDTMVTCDGRMYGKPKTRKDAINTLTRITSSKIPNVVYSGVVIKYKNRIEKFTEVTTVYMGKLTKEEIEAYVDTGEPMDNSGCYRIQGIASSFIERIEGDFNNVIGLPVYRLTEKLKELVLAESND